MEKLTYKNEDQLHIDAVKMLLERHLSWSGSDEADYKWMAVKAMLGL